MTNEELKELLVHEPDADCITEAELKHQLYGARVQRKIDIEKACKWFRDENSHAVSQWLDYECEKLRKAMEE